MLEILDLCKKYPISPRAKETAPAIDGLGLTVGNTGLIVICGKSGSGKSTLMHLIGGFDKPSSGRILYNGTDITKLNKRELDRYRNLCIGFVSQDFGLISNLSVEENVMLSLSLQEKDKDVIDEKVRKALSEVCLEGFEKRRVNTLSGGEKQRVAIARALAQESKLLLCDEPTGNLDPDTADSVFRVLKSISKRISVLTVTHDYNLGKKYSDRLLFLAQGRLVEDFDIKGNISPGIAEPSLNKPNSAKGDAWKGTKLYFGKKSFASLFRANFVPRLVTAVLMTVVLSLLFSVLIASEYVRDYSRPDALYSTLSDYNVSFIKIFPYELIFDEDEKTYKTMWSENDVDSNAAETLKAEYPDSFFGQSYKFTNTFRDFFPEIDLSERTYYRCGAFTHFIAVDSFESFRPELVCGDYPKETNDVLIYDYIAESILHFVSVPGVSKPEQLVGYTMEERDTGLRMTVSGIMKSNYRDFEFADNSDWTKTLDFKTARFTESYLSNLRSVIGFSGMIDEITNGKDYISAFGVIFDMSRPGDSFRTELVTDIDKIPIVYDETDLKLIRYNSSESTYYCISDTLLYELTGIAREELTAARIDELFTEYDFGGRACFVDFWAPYDVALEIDNWGYGIDGVFRSEECQAYLLEKEDESLRKFVLTNGLYEYPVLLLTGESQKDVESIRRLLTPYGSDTEQGGLSETGLGICTCFEIILNNADAFLQDFSEIAGSYFWIGLLAVLALLTAFVIISVQKNQYTIGVLKSVGTPDSAIALVYGASVIIISVIALVVALAGSWAILGFINGVFSETVGFAFRFFSFRIFTGLKTPAAAGGGVVIALLITFIVFLARKPIKLKNAGIS